MKHLFVASAALLFVAPAVLAQETRSYDDRPKITVTGDASVKVQPDRIAISFGIETWNADIEAAKKSNAEIHKKAVAAIKECGVPQKEIQTEHLSIEPRYKNGYTKEDFIGYFVRNTLMVTLNDASKVEELVTKVLQAGVTHLHGIDFQTTELKKHREQARDLALRAALEKAQKMAAVLGQTVGRPIQINENSTGWWYHSSWSGWGYGRSAGMSQNVAQNVPAAAESSDTISLGKISVQANVTVTFELKQ